MLKQRIIETNHGINGDLTVANYNLFSRNMRDKGWNNLSSILNSGIKNGNVLEIGPGPGYLGLEWLKQSKSTNSKLTGCEISREMITLATKKCKRIRTGVSCLLC